MKKKILILTAIPNFDFNNKHSAVAAYLMSIKKNLEVDGYEVMLSHPISSSSSATDSAKTSSNPLKSIVKGISKSVYQSLSDSVYFANQAKLQEELLSKEKPDHIIEFLTYGSEIGAALKAKFNVPLLVIYDSPIAQQYREMHGAYSVFLKKIEKNEQVSVMAADDIICYSEPVKRYLESKHELQAKFHIWPTIIWEKMTTRDKSQDSSDSIDIGFFGSFLKWHKVELLVRVFDSISQEFPDLHLHLVGYGAEWENIKKQVESLSCKNRIHLPGFIDEEALRQLKNTIDIGLMPGSNWYGSPLKIFEYAWLKIPVIAANTPTIAYLFEHEKDLLLIDPDHEFESLKSHFRKILTDKDFSNMLGLNLYKNIAEHYSKEKYYALFSNIVANKQ
ncbi:MAG: glycosyltransferase family 4 protein [Bacteroidia bacterium]|nr:glycosyltransferase family 4 protein [Bacteroidia bacterium]